MQIFSTVLRSFVKMRLTAIAVLLILTTGITVNLVVFALVNITLFRPLPFADARQLVTIDDQLDGKSLGISWGEIQELERIPKLFQSAAVFRKRTWALSDHSGSEMDIVLSGMVSPGFFSVLKTVPLSGTVFNPLESSGSDENVVILSYGLWQKHYKGDAGVVNRSLVLNDVQYKIIGILPKTFSFPIDEQIPDLYIPLDRKDYCCQSSQRGLDGIARLADGISVISANQHLQALAQITARAENLHHFTYEAFPLQAYLARSKRKTLMLLWLSVLALGLIASLNAGALLLARSLRNLHQYAVKITFGAKFGHLLREQIALATVFACIAGVAGLGLSVVIIHVLRLSTLFEPFLSNVKHTDAILDWRVFFFCGILSFVATISACTLPLALLKSISIEHILRNHTGISPSHNGHALRTSLIVAQLTLSVMLFSAVSSFGHSLYILLSHNPGFRTKNIVVAGIGIPDARYDTDEKMERFHEQVLASIRTIPGIENAGFGAGVPVHPLMTGFFMEGAVLPVGQRPRVDLGIVSPEMFQILNLPILRGRDFQSTDHQNEPLVAIVNQAFARHYLDATNPFGRGIRIQFYNGISMKPWSHYSLIGIVADSQNRSIDHEPEPEIYLSTQQIPLEGGQYFLDTRRTASSLTKELPAAVWRVDPQIQKVVPNPEQLFIEASFLNKRAVLYLLLGFTVMALSLAAVGLGSSISASVSETTKEIALRSALGESRISLVGRVLNESIACTLLGTACGIGGSLGLSRIITVSLNPQLHFDFWAVPPVVIFMLLIAALVSIFPVQRALRISPAEALKEK